MDAATQADREYQKSLEKANEKQNRFYETEMPSTLEVSKENLKKKKIKNKKNKTAFSKI